jgi:hypothetical protein
MFVGNSAARTRCNEFIDITISHTQDVLHAAMRCFEPASDLSAFQAARHDLHEKVARLITYSRSNHPFYRVLPAEVNEYCSQFANALANATQELADRIAESPRTFICFDVSELQVGDVLRNPNGSRDIVYDTEIGLSTKNSKGPGALPFNLKLFESGVVVERTHSPFLSPIVPRFDIPPASSVREGQILYSLSDSSYYEVLSRRLQIFEVLHFKPNSYHGTVKLGFYVMGESEILSGKSFDLRETLCIPDNDRRLLYFMERAFQRIDEVISSYLPSGLEELPLMPTLPLPPGKTFYDQLGTRWMYLGRPDVTWLSYDRDSGVQSNLSPILNNLQEITGMWSLIPGSVTQAATDFISWKGSNLLPGDTLHWTSFESGRIEYILATSKTKEGEDPYIESVVFDQISGKITLNRPRTFPPSEIEGFLKERDAKISHSQNRDSVLQHSEELSERFAVLLTQEIEKIKRYALTQYFEISTRYVYHNLQTRFKECLLFADEQIEQIWSFQEALSKFQTICHSGLCNVPSSVLAELETQLSSKDRNRATLHNLRAILKLLLPYLSTDDRESLQDTMMSLSSALRLVEIEAKEAIAQFPCLYKVVLEDNEKFIACVEDHARLQQMIEKRQRLDVRKRKKYGMVRANYTIESIQKQIEHQMKVLTLRGPVDYFTHKSEIEGTTFLYDYGHFPPEEQERFEKIDSLLHPGKIGDHIDLYLVDKRDLGNDGFPNGIESPTKDLGHGVGYGMLLFAQLFTSAMWGRSFSMGDICTENIPSLMVALRYGFELNPTPNVKTMRIGPGQFVDVIEGRYLVEPELRRAPRDKQKKTSNDLPGRRPDAPTRGLQINRAIHDFVEYLEKEPNPLYLQFIGTPLSSGLFSEEGLEQFTRGIFEGSPTETSPLTFATVDYRSCLPTDRAPEWNGVFEFFETVPLTVGTLAITAHGPDSDSNFRVETGDELSPEKLDLVLCGEGAKRQEHTAQILLEVASQLKRHSFEPVLIVFDGEDRELEALHDWRKELQHVVIVVRSDGRGDLVSRWCAQHPSTKNTLIVKYDDGDPKRAISQVRRHLVRLKEEALSRDREGFLLRSIFAELEARSKVPIRLLPRIRRIETTQDAL